MYFKFSTLALACAVLAAAPTAVYGGPIAYGLCQSGCAAVVVACYAGAGAVFGRLTAGVGVPPAILACNAAFGTCSATCAATALLAPIP